MLAYKPLGVTDAPPQPLPAAGGAQTPPASPGQQLADRISEPEVAPTNRTVAPASAQPTPESVPDSPPVEADARPDPAGNLAADVESNPATPASVPPTPTSAPEGIPFDGPYDYAPAADHAPAVDNTPVADVAPVTDKTPEIDRRELAMDNAPGPTGEGEGAKKPDGAPAPVPNDSPTGPRLTLAEATPDNWCDIYTGLHVGGLRSEEHTSELQSRGHLVCRLADLLSVPTRRSSDLPEIDRRELAMDNAPGPTGEGEGAKKPDGAPAPVPNDSPTGPRLTLAEATPDNWCDIYTGLHVGGLLQATVSNCVLVGREGNVLDFILDEANSALFDENHEQRLADGLSDYFGEPVRVRIQLGPVTGETPSARAIRRRQEQYDDAVSAIKNDPLVQQLMTEFDATRSEERRVGEGR